MVSRVHDIIMDSYDITVTARNEGERAICELKEGSWCCVGAVLASVGGEETFRSAKDAGEGAGCPKVMGQGEDHSRQRRASARAAREGRGGLLGELWAEEGGED